MRLPGMSFEDDWTGLVIRDSKVMAQDEAAAIVWSEVGRQVTHYRLGTSLGHVTFCRFGSERLPEELEADVDEAYRRIAISAFTGEPVAVAV
jgi:hypothetical protein